MNECSTAFHVIDQLFSFLSFSCEFQKLLLAKTLFNIQLRVLLVHIRILLVILRYQGFCSYLRMTMVNWTVVDENSTVYWKVVNRKSKIEYWQKCKLELRQVSSWQKCAKIEVLFLVEFIYQLKYPKYQRDRNVGH